MESFTGGASGIGYAIVEELAGFGARIHICDISETLLNQSLSEWEKKGFQVSGSLCDVTSRPGREKVIQTVASLFDGKLNILVNNVGVLRGKPTIEYVEEDFSFHISANLEAAYHFCQLSHPLLKASGFGSIVFMSSIAGIVSVDCGSIYCLTKVSRRDCSVELHWVELERRAKRGCIASGLLVFTCSFLYYWSNHLC